MKWTLWALIFLVFVTPIIFIGKGIDHLDIMKDRYKRAVDAAVDAAVKYDCYENEDDITKMGTGFGEGEDDRKNLAIDKDGMLTWFYRVLFRNIGMDNDELGQLNIKRYIPLKAVIGFDRMIIADVNDNWSQDIYYTIEHNGRNYNLTLSDYMLDTDNNIWIKDLDAGLETDKRKELLSTFIKYKLNQALNNRQNFESGLYYDVNISISDIDKKTNNIEGINFIVLIEGLPLPTLNPYKQEKYFGFSLGGSEVSR